MYKKQLTFQKIVCLLCVIAVAATFVYSLGLATDLHDSLRFAIRNPEKPDKSQIEGARLFYDMQDINRYYVDVSVIMILVSLLLFLTNTNSRRRYYIGNYVAIAGYVGFTGYVTFWSHSAIEAIKLRFQTTVNFEEMKVFSELMKRPYVGPDDTIMFDLHYVVGGLCLLAMILLVANMIWKIVLMRGEKKLIAAAGREEAE